MKRAGAAPDARAPAPPHGTGKRSRFVKTAPFFLWFRNARLPAVPPRGLRTGTAPCAAQKLPPMFSNVSITTTQSGRTFCITCFMMYSGMATQPPV